MPSASASWRELWDKSQLRLACAEGSAISGNPPRTALSEGKAGERLVLFLKRKAVFPHLLPVTICAVRWYLRRKNGDMETASYITSEENQTFSSIARLQGLGSTGQRGHNSLKAKLSPRPAISRKATARKEVAFNTPPPPTPQPPLSSPLPNLSPAPRPHHPKVWIKYLGGGSGPDGAYQRVGSWPSQLC